MLTIDVSSVTCDDPAERPRQPTRSGADEETSMSDPSYEELCAAHRWEVPARYNIAADVCDRHPRDKRR